MLQPDRGVVGPRQATEDDIDEMNSLFSFAFTDRYRRDGLAGVRVPKLNPDIWRYAIRDAADGAMLWFDRSNEIVALNLAHRSGREGWMGPLVVHPEFQEQGVGKLIVSSAVDWLKGYDVSTLGLETMPRTVQNIGFYGKLGFVPGFLTVSVGRDVVASGDGEYWMLSSETPDGRVALLKECFELIQPSLPGYDFTREYQLTFELAVGETLLVKDENGKLSGICLCHTASLAESRKAEELRVLKVFATSLEMFERTVEAVETFAVDAGFDQVSIRAQTGQSHAWAVLQEKGYRVRWTDLRMTLGGFGEPDLSGGEVLYSNWEI